MRTDNDVLKVTQRILVDLGATMADLAIVTDRQQSALTRTLTQNPTVKTLQMVAWALGLGVDERSGQTPPEYHWLCIPIEKYPIYVGVAFRLNFACPLLVKRVDRLSTRLETRYATKGRGPDFNPTDKQMLSQVYPAPSIAGADGQPIDCRFIEAPTASLTPRGTHETLERGPVVALPEPDLLALNDGVPAGYTLSAAARASAPRTGYSRWLAAGWTADKMVEHGYLEETNPATQAPDPSNNVEDLRSETRLRLSQGCPDGWVLSDMALEADDTVSYEQWRNALSDEQLKNRRYMVPAAWLGY